MTTNLFGQEQWERRGEAQTAAATAVSAAMPVGVITAYWATTAPTGWLLCDGAAIPAQYPALIALVGANTPNLKGKVVVGIDAAQVEFDALGETGGSKTSTAPHVHGLNAHNHSGSVQGNTLSHTHGGGSHAHSLLNVIGTSNTAHTHYAGGAPGESSGAPQQNRAGSYAETNAASLTTGVESEAHSHVIGGDSGNTAASSAAATSGNLQPYAALSYIIRAV